MLLPLSCHRQHVRNSAGAAAAAAAAGSGRASHDSAGVSGRAAADDNSADASAPAELLRFKAFCLAHVTDDDDEEQAGRLYHAYVTRERGPARADFEFDKDLDR
jgi:hypothetical protein